MYCGANNHAVHVQATGTTCNVTVFDVNNPLSVALNPTKPCDHSVYNKTCTNFEGALLIDISPALGQDGQLLKQQNPDIQVPPPHHPAARPLQLFAYRNCILGHCHRPSSAAKLDFSCLFDNADSPPFSLRLGPQRV